jgi:RNA polymerase sigma-70 factor (ECF subfamily)
MTRMMWSGRAVIDTPAAPGGHVPDSGEVPDGDLVQLARDGDPVAFRLLVERHQPMVRARARRLCANPSDVDDIMQESFLRAFTALDRLRDPDRFAGWLAGIVLNVCRSLRRPGQPTLVPDWPEPLHPPAVDGLPSAEDLDRAEALRTAVDGLPAGQRRAVTLHYYAGLPPAQIAEPPGAARASLHKARLRLRAYLARHRPDLVPAASGRTRMTTVRIASIERRVPPGPVPDSFPTDLVVLTDDTGRRELPIWLLARDGDRFSQAAGPVAAPREHAAAATARTAVELTGRLLRAAGASVTGVDIDELGPGVTAARIGPTSPAGTRHVTARLGESLAIAATAGAPVRVSDTVMGQLAVPAGTSRPGPLPAPTAAVLRPRVRPRYEPRNMQFADGLNGWLLGGSFAEHASQSHWHDYTCAAEGGIAVLSAAVPQPEGFAFLAQEMYADDYRGAVVVFRGRFRTEATAGEAPASRAGLFLRVDTGARRDIRRPLTEDAVLADPGNHIVTITGSRTWNRYEVTARVPDNCTTVAFGVFLAGRDRIELRDAGLSVSSP